MSVSSRGPVVMPVIAEIDSDSPDLPRRSSLRRHRRHASSANTNGDGDGQKLEIPAFPPPPYSSNNVSMSRFDADSEDLEEERMGSPPPPKKDLRPGWYVKRGGWLRFVLLALLGLVVALALGLGLGLGLGLKKEKKSSSSPPPPPPSTSSPLLFPAGSYSFVAALANISTACTTNSGAFRCYPYTTYSPTSSSTNESQATFLWTIAINSSSSSSSSSRRPDDDENYTPETYTISSTSNPFQPTFDNISLTLVDADQDSERLTFEIPPMVFTSVPQSVTSGDDAATRCYFNNTVLSATIYTRRAATYPPNLSTPVDNTGNGTHVSTDFDAWPYAVEISQVAAAGSGVPDCRDGAGNPVGNLEAPQGAAGDCGCYYQNYNLASS